MFVGTSYSTRKSASCLSDGTTTRVSGGRNLAPRLPSYVSSTTATPVTLSLTPLTSAASATASAVSLPLKSSGFGPAEATTLARHSPAANTAAVFFFINLLHDSDSNPSLALHLHDIIGLGRLDEKIYLHARPVSHRCRPPVWSDGNHPRPIKSEPFVELGQMVQHEALELKTHYRVDLPMRRRPRQTTNDDVRFSHNPERTASFFVRPMNRDFDFIASTFLFSRKCTRRFYQKERVPSTTRGGGL